MAVNMDHEWAAGGQADPARGQYPHPGMRMQDHVCPRSHPLVECPSLGQGMRDILKFAQVAPGRTAVANQGERARVSGKIAMHPDDVDEIVRIAGSGNGADK